MCNYLGQFTHTQNLLLAQKRAARVILDIKDIYHHSKDMFFSLKWMPIHDRIKFRKASMVYKSVNDLAPKDILHMCEIHNLVQKGHLLRIIYMFQLVNMKNCTFRALPIIYGTLSILIFAISKVLTVLRMPISKIILVFRLQLFNVI